MKTYLITPAFILVYGIVRMIDGIDGEYGPGPAWTIGHVAYLVALAFSVPMILDLRRRAAAAGRPGFGLALALATILGVAASAAQFIIDLIAGFTSSSREEMGVFFDRVREVPAAEPLVYSVVPQFLYVGLVALLALLALSRRLVWWSPLTALTGSLLVVADKNLLPVSAVLIGLALAPLAMSRTANARRVVA